MPQSVATPNMNLATWPTTSHFFNHTELGANFTTIDQHDHTSGKGLPIPAGGLAAGAVTSSTLAAGAVGTTALANLAVTTGKIADGAVTGVKLSPIIPSWQNVTNSTGLSWATSSIFFFKDPLGFVHFGTALQGPSTGGPYTLPTNTVINTLPSGFRPTMNVGGVNWGGVVVNSGTGATYGVNIDPATGVIRSAGAWTGINAFDFIKFTALSPYLGS